MKSIFTPLNKIHGTTLCTYDALIYHLVVLIYPTAHNNRQPPRSKNMKKTLLP